MWVRRRACGDVGHEPLAENGGALTAGGAGADEEKDGVGAAVRASSGCRCPLRRTLLFLGAVTFFDWHKENKS